jgi:signal transduction histidine kinase/ActR/RegA family two-component response regulator
MSFQLKTVLGVAVIEAALLFLLVFSSNSALSTSLQSEFEKRATTTLRMLSATARDAILSDDLATLNSFAEAAIQIPDVRYLRITDQSGVLAEAAFPGYTPITPLEAEAEDSGIYASDLLVTVGEQARATIELQFATDTALAARETLQRQNVLIAASEMLLVALFSFLLGRYLTSELKKLQQATAAIAAGELGLVIPTKGSDELANVARGFNRMSQELLRSQVQQLASEERLAAVLDGLRDGVCLLDSRDRVRYLNPQASIYLRSLSPAWREETPLTHLGPHMLKDVAGQAGNSSVLEFESDREIRYFDVSVIEDKESRRRAGERILTMRDITIERAQEQHDRRREQLAVVGQLAAGIAHDFNNILGIIIGVAELNLLEDAEMDATLRADFKTIHEQALRSSKLIRQVLDFSRGGEADSEEIDVGETLLSTVEMLRRTISSMVELHCDIEDDAMLTLFGAAKFQQVIANLVINAVDAMSGSGDIHVAARIREGAELRPNSPPGRHERWIVITITDNGAGIARKNLQRIFEPFFTTKEKSKGSGLGLAQVYGIMQRQGGDIHVDSTVGKGSCFSLYLKPSDGAPAVKEPPRLAASAAPADTSSGATVLLVEDQDSLRKTVALMLRSLGYEVVTASTGEQGLEKFDAERHRIDAILSDAVMPGIGGIEMISRLRKGGCKVPVALMSGYFERDREELDDLDSEINAYLQKPVSRDDLAETMHKLFAQGRSPTDS